MGKKRGTQCSAIGCKKRKKSKADQRDNLSASEGDSDDESHSKRQHPRTFHKYVSIMY